MLQAFLNVGRLNKKLKKSYLILESIATIILCAILYYSIQFYKFDPDYYGYMDVYNSSIVMNVQQDRLFYWIAHSLSVSNGYADSYNPKNYINFRYLVLGISVFCFVSAMCILNRLFGDERVSKIYAYAFLMGLAFVGVEVYYVRIRVGLAESLTALGLAIFLNLSSKKSKKSVGQIGVYLLVFFLNLAALLIHFSASVLMIVGIYSVYITHRFLQDKSPYLLLVLGFIAVIFVDSLSYDRHQVLYSNYNIFRFFIFNLCQIFIFWHCYDRYTFAKSKNYFDHMLFLMAGITFGIGFVMMFNHQIISGEALVRFQGVFLVLAIIGSLYSTLRLRYAWLYYVLSNGIFFINTIARPHIQISNLKTIF